MDKYVCLKRSDVVVPEEDEEESSSDEDDEDEEEDEDEEDGEGSDGEALGTPKELPMEAEVEVGEKEEDVSGFH